MFKKTITFTDFNDNTQTQDFYFHMSKEQLLGMAADSNEMMARIQRIIDAKNGAAILQELRELIKMSCGVRSEDGSRFIKTPEAQSTLLDSPAYDELLMELATDENACVNFVNQLLPEKLQKEMQEQLGKQKGSTQDPFAEQEDNRPAWMKEHRNPTPEELRNMGPDELRLAFQHRK